jgi:molecular chaperone DnaJ
MRGPLADYYAVLGVTQEVSTGELRRAYRLLALQFHPDRAGAAGTARFQQISEAYAVLADATSRAAYDAIFDTARARRQAEGQQRPGTARADRAAGGANGFEEGTYEGPGGRIGWRRKRQGAAVVAGRVLDRLCGALDDLIARAVLRRCPDGVIEVPLASDEAEHGGVAAIEARVTLCCPTCSGLAERHVLWCRRCEYAGTVMDDVTFTLEVPAYPRDRLTFSFETDPSGSTAPLRLRLRVG